MNRQDAKNAKMKTIEQSESGRADAAEGRFGGLASFFVQKQPILAPDGVKSVTNQCKSATNQYKSVANQYKSVTNQYESVTDQYWLLTDQYKLVTDQYRSVANQYKSVTD
jgi:hypothetical protein